jgi:transcriptional regulator with XRE-family HTH domain
MNDWRERLRLAIELSGKKHSTVAWEAGVARATLSRVLTGRHAHPTFDTVVRITHAVGENVGWILHETRAPLSAEETEKMSEIAAFLVERFPKK